MPNERTLPVAVRVLDGAGNVCADLTPNIRKAIGELNAGEILEVIADDPAARVGVPAWSRLTGHELVATVEQDDTHTKFFIKHK